LQNLAGSPLTVYGRMSCCHLANEFEIFAKRE